MKKGAIKNFRTEIVELAAKALGAVEFINWLDQSDLGYDIHDADNMLDYNQGNFNMYVFQTETQLWFYDGVLVNVNGEELYGA